MRGHCCCCCCINLFIQTDKILLLLSAVSAQCSDVLHEYGHRAADTILGLLNKHLLDNNQCYEHARGAGHGSCSGERPRLHPIHLPTVEFGWQPGLGSAARWQDGKRQGGTSPWLLAGQCWHRSHIAVIIITRSLPCHQTRSHCRYTYTLNTLTYTDILLLEWARETIDVLEMRNPPSKTTGAQNNGQSNRLDIRYICFMTNFQQLQNWCRILNVAAVVLVAGAGEVLCTE